MTTTLLVTGATGFTGRRTVPMLLDQGFKVRCLVRPQSDVRRLASLGVELVHGDLALPESLPGAFEGVTGLVSIAPLEAGYAEPLVQTAVAQGIQRAVFVSSTSIFTRLNAETKAIRLAAEKCIADSGLWYTILRPTMIYGTAEDRNISRLIRYLNRWPALFIPGHGMNASVCGGLRGSVIHRFFNHGQAQTDTDGGVFGNFGVNFWYI